MLLSDQTSQWIEIVITITAFLTVYVGLGVKRMWPDHLPGHIASWATPIGCLLCCGIVFGLSWFETPRTFGSYFGMSVSVAVALLILLVVYLYRWEKKHYYRNRAMEQKLKTPG